MQASDNAAPQDALKQALRTAGLRATAGRVTLLAFLASAKRPLSHADIAAKFVPAGFDRASLYRHLRDLAQAGLLERSDLGDHVWRFELRRACVAQDPKDKRAPRAVRSRAHPRHPHFVCQSCGDVVCLEGTDLRVKAGAQVPKSLKRHEVEIHLRGVCDGCGDEP